MVAHSDKIIELDFPFCYKADKFRGMGSGEAKALRAGIHWWFVCVYILAQCTATQRKSEMKISKNELHNQHMGNATV